MSKYQNSILLVLTISLGLFIVSTTLGCGDDPDEWEQTDPTCNEWDSDACEHDEICHDDNCQSIILTDFEIEIIDGEMPIADEYGVSAIYRGDVEEYGFDFATTESPPTTTPEWRESFELQVTAQTDWWQVVMVNASAEEIEFFCQIEFNKEQFGHSTGAYVCGDDTENFTFEITPT